MNALQVAVIGAGAAGYFAALRHKKLFPGNKVILFEKTSKVLGKVRISGGGRCNVTHAEFVPKELVKAYPRGGKELLGPFHHFQPADTIQWFEDRGVKLKTEEDGRVFPVTNKSQTIIDCLENERIKLDVELKFHHSLSDIHLKQKTFELKFENGNLYQADQLIITTGSNEVIWKILHQLGHTIIPPVPSLFTFNIKDSFIDGFPGTSWPNVAASFENIKISSHGPVLITHWGLSGPAILKLSAFAARELSSVRYHQKLKVNFMHPYKISEVIDILKETKQKQSNKLVQAWMPDGFTVRLWQHWVSLLGYANKKWQEVSIKSIEKIAIQLSSAEFQLSGKSTYKDEFVTCGGIDLKEIDMKNLESRLIPNLFFAGEVLNIDAITGGFNFQSAWTTGWLAGSNA
ncbi:MAG: NAD(P)/FAD-dependent oxidoreductase [Saprospiraceae bacterium]